MSATYKTARSTAPAFEFPKFKSPLTDTIVTFDTETTGLHPLINRVIELGAVRWRNGEPVDKFQTLVNPGEPIDPRSIAIHGITDEDVRDAPGIGAVLDDFLAFIGDAPLAGHNVGFDAAFILVEAMRANRTLPVIELLDTLTLSRLTFPGLRSHKLSSLSCALTLGGGTFHRALADALLTGKLLYRALAEHPNVPKRAWSRLDQTAQVQLPRRLQSLRQALNDGSYIQLQYPDDKGVCHPRTVEPLGLISVMGKDYFRALCLRQREERTYRVEKIREAKAVPPIGLLFA
jgi:DNA polymerase III subunit epsilon